MGSHREGSPPTLARLTAFGDPDGLHAPLILRGKVASTTKVVVVVVHLPKTLARQANVTRFRPWAYYPDR